MKAAVMLVILAIRELAKGALPFWKAQDIEKILDKAEKALKED